MQDKLIKQICRFYLDGKFSWGILDKIDRHYLLDIAANGKYHSYESEATKILIDRIKKLVPFFFED